MKGRIVPAALIGAGGGLYLDALRRTLEALLWPRGGGALFLLALLGASAGAAAVFIAGEKGKVDFSRGSPCTLCLFWGAAALGVLLPLSAAATGPGAGMPWEVGALSVAFVAILAVPAALLAAALLSGGGSAGFFLIGLGASMASVSSVTADPRSLGLAGILLGTVPALGAGGRGALPRRTGAGILLAAVILLLVAGDGEWSGEKEKSVRWGSEGKLEALEVGEGWGMIDVSGGLRRVLYRSPTSRTLPFPVSRGDDGKIDVLSIGFPGDDLLRDLLGQGATVVVFEADQVLTEEILRRRPDLQGEAAVRFVHGDLRRFLGRKRGEYDLLILGGAVTPAAHIAAATAFREDYTATVEAFRAYREAMAPGALLYSERPGNGKIVTALREAALHDDLPFERKIVVMGRKGRIVSQCWFRPSGFDNEDMRRMNDYARGKGLEIFISPETRRKWNFYGSLVRGDLVKGYYFTSPQDLSPARDDRPFFGHFERLMISPAGKPLPEERDRRQAEWRLGFIPPGDRSTWLVPAAGILFLPLLILVPGALLAHRCGLFRHSMRYPWVFLLLGLSIAAALRSLGGYGRWLGHGDSSGLPVTAIFLAAAGVGWLAPSRSDGAWKWTGIPLAIVLVAVGTAGYAADGPRGFGAALLLFLLASTIGLAAGRLTGSFLHCAEDVLPGTRSWYCSFLLLGGVCGWALSNLAAVSFGFPVIWLLAAAGLLAAGRVGRTL